MLIEQKQSKYSRYWDTKVGTVLGGEEGMSHGWGGALPKGRGVPIPWGVLTQRKTRQTMLWVVARLKGRSTSHTGGTGHNPKWGPTGGKDHDLKG